MKPYWSLAGKRVKKEEKKVKVEELVVIFQNQRIFVQPN